MDREDVLPTPPPGAAIPTVLAERYQLDRSLGNGGMGEVFEATDLTLHRSVAVKLLSSSLVQDEPARARFLREARALAQVNSPHVVAVYDAGEDDERPYLVMELVEGTTLEHELERPAASNLRARLPSRPTSRAGSPRRTVRGSCSAM